MTNEQFAELLARLNEADESEYGIELEFQTNADLVKFRQKLYTVRREYEEFSKITLVEHNNKLWLVKGAAPDGRTNAT